MSYSPATHAVYSCQTKNEMALGAVPTALRKPYVGGEGYTNVGFGKLVSYGGTITAVDVNTNKHLWQLSTTPTGTCYGGSSTTAGGLLLLGSLDGNFHALDAATGKSLWTKKLAYGADAPPISYAVNGKQYIAILAGGSLLGSAKGSAPHGDGVYVFALNG
jgi:quinohemoprotein ethanol dehydrogenase